jgi:hypothetical protein
VSAVWLRATAQLRGRARATVLLAVLVGLAGGMVLAAVAGARRTDAALPRFLAFDRPRADAIIYSPSGGQQRREVRVLAALPEVARATRISTTIVASPDPAYPTGLRRTAGFLALDRGGSWRFGRPIVVAGRLFDERRADEAVVDEELAARRHLAVGSTWRIGAYTMAQLQQAGSETPTPPAGPTVALRIVGIVRHPGDLLPIVTDQDNLHVNHNDLYLTPAYWQRYGPDLAGYGVNTAVALHHGQADLSRLVADVRRLLGPQVFVNSIDPNDGGAPSIRGGTIPGLRRAIRLEAGALLAFAALAAIATLLLVGQTLGRQVYLESVEYPTLRALGMTRGQLVGVALIRAAVIGTGGAMVALAITILLSPLAPIGLARRAELDPGTAVDLAVLAPGGLAVVALGAAYAAVAAWRAGRAPATALGLTEPAGAGRPSRVADALAAAGLPPTAVTGVRLALEPGRGRTAVPIRSAIAGAAAAVCAVVAVGVFGASLARLVGTPAAYGWTWDISVGNFASPPEARRAARILDATPGVDAYAGVATEELLIDGKRVQFMAIEPSKGTVPLQMLEGREPVRPGEVALGTATLDPTPAGQADRGPRGDDPGPWATVAAAAGGRPAGAKRRPNGHRDRTQQGRRDRLRNGPTPRS